MLAALLLCLVIVVAQVLSEDGPLISLDRAVQRLALEQRWPEAYPIAKAFELFGQRALVYAIALVIIGALAWRARTWRPLVLLCGSLLTLNVIVGTSKVLTARRKPFTGDISVFEGGPIFPSGHAANVVLAWGVVCYLLVAYGRWRASRRGLATVVAAASLAMGAASVYLNTHWVTDLLAGWLVGAAILEGTMLLDRRARPGRRPATRPTTAPRPAGARAGAPTSVPQQEDAGARRTTADGGLARSPVGRAPQARAPAGPRQPSRSTAAAGRRVNLDRTASRAGWMNSDDSSA